MNDVACVVNNFALYAGIYMHAMPTSSSTNVNFSTPMNRHNNESHNAVLPPGVL